GAVGAQEAEGLAAPHLEVDPLDRLDLAEPLDQPLGGDHRAVAHALLRLLVECLPEPRRRALRSPARANATVCSTCASTLSDPASAISGTESRNAAGIWVARR